MARGCGRKKHICSNVFSCTTTDWGDHDLARGRDGGHSKDCMDPTVTANMEKRMRTSQGDTAKTMRSAINPTARTLWKVAIRMSRNARTTWYDGWINCLLNNKQAIYCIFIQLSTTAAGTTATTTTTTMSSTR